MGRRVYLPLLFLLALGDGTTPVTVIKTGAATTDVLDDMVAIQTGYAATDPGDDTDPPELDAKHVIEKASELTQLAIKIEACADDIWEVCDEAQRTLISATGYKGQLAELRDKNDLLLGLLNERDEELANLRGDYDRSIEQRNGMIREREGLTESLRRAYERAAEIT